MTKLALITPATAEPITLSEAKAHLRVEIAEDDAFISALIKAAREHVESITSRAVVTQTWELVLDSFPADEGIVLPLSPLRTVDSIAYQDAAGVTTTMSSSEYIVDTVSALGQVVPVASWPSARLAKINAIRVRFTAGYVTVPQTIKQAMLLLVGWWYEQREAVVFGKVKGEGAPFAVQALLAKHQLKHRWF